MTELDERAAIKSITSRYLTTLLEARDKGRSAISVANKMNFLNLYCDADWVTASMSGIISEYEIKVSRADFLRDKKKLRAKIYGNERPGNKPNYFWYVTAPGIITEEDLPSYAGWLEETNGNLVERRPAPKMSTIKHGMITILRMAKAMRKRYRDKTL